MKTRSVDERYLLAISLIIAAATGVHAADTANGPPIELRSITLEPGFDKARLNAVGQAVGYLEWPAGKARRVAPRVSKSLLSRPELVTRESSSCEIVWFEQAPWGQQKWSWERLTENHEALPTELPPDRKKELLTKVPPARRNDPAFVENYLKSKLESEQEYRDKLEARIAKLEDADAENMPGGYLFKEYLDNVNALNISTQENARVITELLNQLKNGNVRVNYKKNNGN